MRMTIDEMIEVLQGYKDGKEVEFSNETITFDQWRALTIPSPAWNFENFRYRLKPKSKEQLRIEELEARVKELEKEVFQLNDTINHYQSIGVEAYDIACEEMEAWQKKRIWAGKEVGTEGSLVDGIGWLYSHIDKLEEEVKSLDGGWIPNTFGVQPVLDDTIVEVKVGGKTYTNTADKWYWGRDGKFGIITAYRIVK